MEKDNIEPAEGTDRKFEVTDGGKLEKVEDESVDFEEDLTFDE